MSKQPCVCCASHFLELSLSNYLQSEFKITLNFSRCIVKLVTKWPSLKQRNRAILEATPI